MEVLVFPFPWRYCSDSLEGFLWSLKNRQLMTWKR